MEVTPKTIAKIGLVFAAVAIIACGVLVYENLPSVRKDHAHSTVALAFKTAGIETGVPHVVAVRDNGKGVWTGTVLCGKILYGVSFDERDPNRVDWWNNHRSGSIFLINK